MMVSEFTACGYRRKHLLQSGFGDRIPIVKHTLVADPSASITVNTCPSIVTRYSGSQDMLMSRMRYRFPFWTHITDRGAEGFLALRPKPLIYVMSVSSNLNQYPSAPTRMVSAVVGPSFLAISLANLVQASAYTSEQEVTVTHS